MSSISHDFVNANPAAVCARMGRRDFNVLEQQELLLATRIDQWTPITVAIFLRNSVLGVDYVLAHSAIGLPQCWSSPGRLGHSSGRNPGTRRCTGRVGHGVSP